MICRGLFTLLCCALAGCASTQDESWKGSVRQLISQGQYDRAIQLAESHLTTDDEPERNAALSLIFGARIGQLKRTGNLKTIQRAISNRQILGQLEDRRHLPETQDRLREEIIHRAGFDEGISPAGPALKKQLQSRIPLLDLQQAEVSTLFKKLFGEANINILADPAVIKGKRVTISAKDISVAEVLEHLATIHGFHYRFRERSVLVRSAGEPSFLTRTYRLHRGLAEFDQSSTFNSLGDLGLLVSVARGSIGGGSDSSGGDSNSSLFADRSSTANQQSRRGANQPGDERGNRSFIDLLVERLPELVEWPKGSTAYLDRRNNLLVVRGTPATLHQVGTLLKSIDENAPQILIEVRYLEVASDQTVDLGVEWTLDRRFEGPVLDPDLRGDAAASGPSKSEGEVSTRSGTFFGLPSFVGGSTNGGTLRVVGIFDETVVDALVYALNRVEGTETLASPQVIASNNSRAQIAIVRNLTFVERFEIVPGTTSQTQESVVNTPTTVRAVINDSNFTGVLLNVKPSVGADGHSLHIVLQPVIRDQVGEIIIERGAIIVDNGREVSTPALTRPILETRLVTTQLTIEDGATVVLGGLMTARDVKREEKIPVLGDLPGVGFLFRRTTTIKQKRNLLIFVRARIINPTGGRYKSAAKPNGKKKTP